MRTVRIVAIVLALAAVSAFLATQWVEHVMTVALPVKAPMTLVVEKGSNLNVVARDL
jgi:hypothetical protein